MPLSYLYVGLQHIERFRGSIGETIATARDAQEADVALAVATEGCTLAHDALKLVGFEKPRDVALGSKRTRLVVGQVDPVVEVAGEEDDTGGDRAGELFYSAANMPGDESNALMTPQRLAAQEA